MDYLIESNHIRKIQHQTCPVEGNPGQNVSIVIVVLHPGHITPNYDGHCCPASNYDLHIY